MKKYLFPILFIAIFLVACKKDKLNWTLTVANKTNESVLIYESTYDGPFLHTMTVGANDTLSQKSMIVKVPYYFKAINTTGDTLGSFQAKGKYKKEIIWAIE